jgi:hypothetical protein
MSTQSVITADYGHMEVVLRCLQNEVEDRCGSDAKLVVDLHGLSIEQPTIFGKMPGTLSTDLVNIHETEDEESSDELLRFNVAFRTADAFEFEPVDRGSYCTNLPATLEPNKLIVALTAIHETAKAHLTDGFSRAMALMSSLEPAAIEKLITN